MKDIAPELLEKIKKSFEEGMEQNGAMKKLEARLKSREGGFEEAEQYAGEVGRALSAAFGEHLSSDVLPDGRMYFNIADRVVTPLMEEEYRLATEAGMEAVRAANERAGIHLQGWEPAFEPERVKGIVDRLASEESFDAVKWILGDPVENYAVHCVDETVKKNAEFLHKSGRTARIRRDSASRCCDWCADLDGVYEYPGVPREIYARHNNCTCTVEYLPGDGKAQDVWSKNSRDVSTREERRIFSERAISKEEAEERIRRAEEIKKTLQEGQKKGIVRQERLPLAVSAPAGYDRFEGIEPLSITEEERAVLQELRKLTAGDGVEHIQVLYSDGFSELFSGDLNSAGYILRDGHGDARLFHSHTNNTTFSDTDLVKLLNERIEQIGVITPDGSAYVCLVGSGWLPTREEFESAIRSTKEAADITTEGLDGFAGWSIVERAIVARNEQTYLIARHFEWLYEGGVIDE